MKFTEGGFKNWGYELAEKEFGKDVFAWTKYQKIKEEQGKNQAEEAYKQALAEGKIESYYSDNPFPKSIEGACYKMMARSFKYYK